MKYIKLFEDLSGFEEIPPSEIDSTIAVPFSEIDLELISKAIYPNKISLTYFGLSVDSDTKLILLGWAAPIGKPIEDVKDEELSFAYTFQKTDEWFYVFFATDSGKLKSYKCDQIEGLIHCLKGFNFTNRKVPLKPRIGSNLEFLIKKILVDFQSLYQFERGIKKDPNKLGS